MYPIDISQKICIQIDISQKLYQQNVQNCKNANKSTCENMSP